MSKIVFFLEGKPNQNNESFTSKLSVRLPKTGIVTQYSDENPYIMIDLLPREITGFVVDIENKNLSIVLVLALKMKLPICFFGKNKFSDLSLHQRFFIQQLEKIHGCCYAEEVEPDENRGSHWLGYQLSQLFKF